MADVSTVATADASETSARGGEGRRIRRQRGLPGGRAVVGALLVSAAAVAVFAAYLNATSEPATRYVVADTAIAPGTMIEDRQAALELFSAAPIDLLPPVDQRVFLVEELDSLVGQVVIVAMERGDLLQRSAVLEAGGVGDAQVMSFSVSRADAVAGDLVPGERIDVLATYSLSGETFTAFIVRGVPLVAVEGGTGSGGGSVTLTVAVSSLEDVQALGHAVNTASVFVTRSTASAEDPDRAPGAFVPSPDAPGPLPDPAAVLRPGDASDQGNVPADGDAPDEQSSPDGGAPGTPDDGPEGDG
jgi:Flp pilus assembly protein CpaB